MLAGLAALAAPLPARARIYADTVNTVGESLDQIRAKGRLRVGVYADFAPFSADGAAGPQGIDVDLARLIAERLGVRLDLVLIQAGDTVDDDLRNYVWRGTVVDHGWSTCCCMCPTIASWSCAASLPCSSSPTSPRPW